MKRPINPTKLDDMRLNWLNPWSISNRPSRFIAPEAILGEGTWKTCMEGQRAVERIWLEILNQPEVWVQTLLELSTGSNSGFKLRYRSKRCLEKLIQNLKWTKWTERLSPFSLHSSEICHHSPSILCSMGHASCKIKAAIASVQHLLSKENPLEVRSQLSHKEFKGQTSSLHWITVQTFLFPRFFLPFLSS